MYFFATFLQNFCRKSRLRTRFYILIIKSASENHAFRKAHPYLPTPRLTEGVKAARIKKACPEKTRREMRELNNFSQEQKPRFLLLHSICAKAPQRVKLRDFIICVPLNITQRGQRPKIARFCFISLKQNLREFYLSYINTPSSPSVSVKRTAMPSLAEEGTLLPVKSALNGSSR